MVVVVVELEMALTFPSPPSWGTNGSTVAKAASPQPL